jgi:hypothetical protein
MVGEIEKVGEKGKVTKIEEIGKVTKIEKRECKKNSKNRKVGEILILISLDSKYKVRISYNMNGSLTFRSNYL